MLPAQQQDEDKTTVVVIEDHSMVREGLVALISSQMDIEVVAQCADAHGGLEKIKELNPDIVLTDIGLPDCPFEMVRQARETNPNFKVIFITAYDTDVNLERALEVGAGGFISKFAASKNVCDAIRSVKEGQDYFSDDLKDRLTLIRDRSEESGKKYAAKHRLLSPREFEVLRLVAKGHSAKAIAEELKISVKTVDRHKSNIMSKLNLHSQVELTRYAIREGLITL